ncbi:hypothetical protein N8935_07705 [Amylibacter sp.]|nr:hypothetical protein [Amylibacter sp.]
MKNLLIIILLILYGSHGNAGINYWSYQTSVDPFTDETNSYASFQTRNDEKRITVRCQNNKFDILINFNKYIKRDGGNKLKYRIDKNTFIQSDDWGSSTKGTAVFASDKLKLKLAKELTNGDKKAIFRVYDFNGTKYDMIINFTSARRLITKVIQDCNINLDKALEAVQKKRLEEKAFEKRSFEEEALELKKIIEVSTENVPKEFNNFQQELLESQKTSNEILVEKTLKSIEEQLSGKTGFEKIEIERLQNEIKENLSIIFD